MSSDTNRRSLSTIKAQQQAMASAIVAYVSFIREQLGDDQIETITVKGRTYYKAKRKGTYSLKPFLVRYLQQNFPQLFPKTYTVQQAHELFRAVAVSNDFVYRSQSQRIAYYINPNWDIQTKQDTIK